MTTNRSKETKKRPAAQVINRQFGRECGKVGSFPQTKRQSADLPRKVVELVAYARSVVPNTNLTEAELIEVAYSAIEAERRRS